MLDGDVRGGSAPFRCISAEFCSHFPPAIRPSVVRSSDGGGGQNGRRRRDEGIGEGREGGGSTSCFRKRASKNDIRGQQNATHKDGQRFHSICVLYKEP